MLRLGNEWQRKSKLQCLNGEQHVAHVFCVTIANLSVIEIHDLFRMNDMGCLVSVVIIDEW